MKEGNNSHLIFQELPPIDCWMELYCSSVSLTDTILCFLLVCALRLQTPTLSCVKTRRRNLWKTTDQRPSRAPLVETEMLPGAEAEESRARRVPRRSPAMSR